MFFVWITTCSGYIDLCFNFVLLLPIVCGIRGVEDSPLQPPISRGGHGASIEDA